MSSSIPYPDKYHAAVKYVEVVTDGGKLLKDEAQLLLYALHQQVQHGACAAPKPWGWNVIEGAKWQSWHQLGNLSKMEAMRLYVRTLEEEQSDWYPLLLAAEAAKPEPVAGAAPTTSAAAPAEAAAAPSTTAPAVLKPTVEYAKDGSWTPLPLDDQKRPVPRYEHAAGLVAGSVYVVGGNYAGGRYLNDCWRFNLVTTQWSLLNLKASSTSPPPTTPAVAAAAAAPAAKGAAPENSNGAVAAHPAFTAVAGHQVVVWGNMMYVLGGHVKGKDAKAAMSVRVIDTSTLVVSGPEIKGDAPVARGGHTATLVGSKVYVFGGEDAGRRTLGDLRVLDLDTLTWSQPETTGTKPSPRSAHAATAYQGRYILVFGGGSVATCYSDVSVLDTQTLTWSVPPVTGAKVTPRAGHAGGVLGDSWYLVGGGNNVKGCTEMFSLDLSALPAGGPLVWSVVLSIPLRDPLSSEGITLLPLESSKVLVAFGGYNGKYQNSINVFRAPSAAAAAAAAASAVSPAVPSPPAAAAAATTNKRGAGAAAGQEEKPLPPSAAAVMGGGGPSQASRPAPPAEVKPAGPTPAETIAELRTQLDAVRKEADAAVSEVGVARGAAAHEVKMLRTQLAAAQAGQADTQKALDDTRLSLQREQGKVLKLEAEAAELHRRLGAMADLEKEVEKQRRVAKEAEEAKLKAAGGGLWGYLAGSGSPAPK